MELGWQRGVMEPSLTLKGMRGPRAMENGLEEMPSSEGGGGPRPLGQAQANWVDLCSSGAS